MKKLNECKKCGNCCTELEIDLRDEDAEDEDFIRWVELHGITFNKEEESVVIPLKCKMLDKNNKCRIYENRPKVCRDWKSGVDCDSLQGE